MAAPLTDDERAHIVELIEAGNSRADICRQTGRGGATISRVAAGIGHNWLQAADLRTKSVLVRAHDARSAYSAERRALIAARLTEEAELLLDEMHESHLAFNFGGKDNTYEEHELDEPPIEGKRALMQAARDAMRTVLEISKHDTEGDRGTSRGLLIGFTDALRAQHGDGSSEA